MRFAFLQPIQVRLWLAFLAVAAVSVVGAVTSLVSDSLLSGTIQRFGSGTLPQMVAAQSLLDAKSALIEETRALAKTEEAGDLDKRKAAARGQLTKLRSLSSERLPALGASEVASELRPLIDRFEASLTAVDKATGHRLEARTRRDELVENMDSASRAARSLAEPLARALREQLAGRIGSLAAAGDMRRLQDIDKNEVAWLINVQRLRTEAENLRSMLTAAAGAQDDATLRGVEAQIAMATPRLREPSGLPETPFTSGFEASMEALVGYTAPPDSIVEARAAELAAQHDIDAALTANTQAGDQLSKALGQFAETRSAATGQAIDNTVGEIRAAMSVQAILAFLALATAALIGWFYVRGNLVRRILHLRDAMRAISGGDLEYRVAVKGQDELASMAEALAIFRDNARKIAQLQQQQEEARQAAERERRQALLSMADALESGAGRLLSQVAEAAAQLDGSAGDMSRNAEAASREADSVAGATNQAAIKVDSAAGAAQEMAACIQEIARHVAGSTSASGSARDEAGTAQHKVGRLKEAAEKIGDIVQLIRGIAAKTHLLALNATIEAARAGEAGKGFVIVAGEVNNLANQTASATEEIERQVGAIQIATGDSVQSIETILKAVEHVNELNMSASGSLEQQSAATQEIARSMTEMAELISAVHSGMDTVNHSTHANETTAVTLRTAAARLSADTEALGTEVNRFLGQIRNG
ncbi:methyl-accepting chemotaxis protein [Telmatospirillum siberiense]|uniref:methyl-accepting chemotaxis protein n=1 Tax=Telmatospirillum siberiense TaxID=382514 RepID=UPI0011AEF486|nr:HAMP domain-containing methyl-accepting chemotaxis protein [Telmatospirillum siberiense]